MKFNSLFRLIISLATVSSLVDIHPAYAQKPRCFLCGIITKTGAVRGSGTLPPYLSQRLNVLIDQGNFADAEGLLTQFLEQSEKTQDINGQAAAHQALGDVYARMSKLDLASSHLKNADVLYQRLENSQSYNEVQIQLQQIQLQQIQLQQIQLQKR